MLEGKSVAIIGAGIAGLSSSIALARRGARVTVLEQAAEIAEVGAGIQITPNGIAVLDALGLQNEIRSIGTDSGSVTLRNFRNSVPITRLDLLAKRAGRPYLLVHRADLIDMLLASARASGVEILVSTPVQKVTDRAEGVEIGLSDGHDRPADILVGADGINSVLRRTLIGDAPARFTGQVAWRALVKGPAKQGVNVYLGPGKHVVTYPIRSGELTNIVAVEERRDWTQEGWNHPADVEELRNTFSQFSDDVSDLLDRVQTAHIWGLHRHPVADNWSGASSVLVGDAAHPTLPFLGQGANMALEDSWVLAACLANSPVESAFANYALRRRRRVELIIGASNANARHYHIRNTGMRFSAHMMLRGISKLAPEYLNRRFDWLYQHDVTTQ